MDHKHSALYNYQKPYAFCQMDFATFPPAVSTILNAQKNFTDWAFILTERESVKTRGAATRLPYFMAWMQKGCFDMQRGGSGAAIGKDAEELRIFAAVKRELNAEKLHRRSAFQKARQAYGL